MLLGDCLLTSAAPETSRSRWVGRIWRHRERVEREASSLFKRISGRLSEVGAPRPLVTLAREASEDETRHAQLCARMVECALGAHEPLPLRATDLGPVELGPRERLLYVVTAVSCVTETLSTALLLEMQKRAKGEAARTVHEILRDEIGHAQLGWAFLDHEARARPVQWIGAHVSRMLLSALPEGLESGGGDRQAPDLSDFAILPPEDVLRIARQTVRDVIAPGLASSGIAFDAAAVPWLTPPGGAHPVG